MSGSTFSLDDPHLCHEPRFLVLELEGRVVGSVMAGYHGHRGVGELPRCRAGAPRRRLRCPAHGQAERWLAQAGGPKVNLQVWAANEQVVAFYRHLAYAVDDVVGMGKRLVDDTARELPGGSSRRSF